jgi:membrane-bound lytic murein transglycosylase D
MAVVLLLFSACATTPKQAKTIPQDHFAEIQRPDIPLVMNDRVQDWLNYFQGPGRGHFERYLRRSTRYIPMIRTVLKQHGLPEDLVYLAMIESGFNPHAYSRARATGTWQFIYQTGIRYGLKVDSWIDERRDPEKSTVAAAKYLKNLYDRYNNWYLAAAGYNAGEGKIDRAIRKYATEDFWELAQKRYLRAETKDYVPKLIAAALIARNPAKYGFKTVAYEEPVGFDEVTLDGPIDLRVAAKCAGTTYEDLKTLNPELLHWVTPPDYVGYRLKVPAGSSAKFLKKYASLSPEERLGGEEKLTVEASQSVASLAKEHEMPPVLLAAANGLSVDEVVKRGRTIVLPLAPPEGEEFYEKVYERAGRRGGKVIVYRVRGGDNITRVSQRTGISVKALRRYNAHVNWSHLRKGQKIRLYAAAAPERGRKAVKHRRGGQRIASIKSDAPKTASTSEPQNGYVTHKIQPGDTLSEIAQKYNVSARELKAVNNISSPKRIRAGKTIKIPAPQNAATTSAPGAPSM